VGGGKAGARAAVAFRENAWKGNITLISDEALAPYDRPPLSKAAIMDEADVRTALVHPLVAFCTDSGAMGVDGRHLRHADEGAHHACGVRGDHEEVEVSDGLLAPPKRPRDRRTLDPCELRQPAFDLVRERPDRADGMASAGLLQ
jgi:NADPH-dependent 2,4-dienoyl-CoA reductase/sulfur reductase-like enzyme